MSAKTFIIITSALVGLGLASRSRAGESEAAPPPKGQVFDQMDQNHDGVIQREEFEQFHRERDSQRERGDRPRFERGDGERPRGRLGGEEELGKRINEAVDRALERSAGDPQQLRQILREELMRSMPRRRGPQGSKDGPPPPRGPAGVDENQPPPPTDGPPPTGPRGFGERRGPDAGEGARRGRRGRGREGGDGAGYHRPDPEQRAERIMQRLDVNHDGALTPDETGDRADRLMKADVNSDGRVDPSELRGFLQNVKDQGGRRPQGPPPEGAPVPPPGE